MKEMKGINGMKVWANYLLKPPQSAFAGATLHPAMLCRGPHPPQSFVGAFLMPLFIIWSLV